MRRTNLLGLLLVLIARDPATALASAEDSPVAIIESKFELFVHDPIESAAFYKVLGIVTVHAKPYGYTTLRGGSTVIALSPLPWWLPIHWLGFLRYPPIGTEIVLYVNRLERARDAFGREGYSPGEIAVQAWGDRDFRIRDPDGYYIRVSEGVAVPNLTSSD